MSISFAIQIESVGQGVHNSHVTCIILVIQRLLVEDSYIVLNTDNLKVTRGIFDGLPLSNFSASAVRRISLNRNSQKISRPPPWNSVKEVNKNRRIEIIYKEAHNGFSSALLL